MGSCSARRQASMAQLISISTTEICQTVVALGYVIIFLIGIISVILGLANQHFIKCQSSICHVNAALIFGKFWWAASHYEASIKVWSAESVLLYQETFDWFYPVHLDGIQCCPPEFHYAIVQPTSSSSVECPFLHTRNFCKDTGKDFPRWTWVGRVPSQLWEYWIKILWHMPSLTQPRFNWGLVFGREPSSWFNMTTVKKLVLNGPHLITNSLLVSASEWWW